MVLPLEVDILDPLLRRRQFIIAGFVAAICFAMVFAPFLLSCRRRKHEPSAWRVAGWSFAALVIGLGGQGVYIGRFLRWNSWDFVTNPLTLFQNIFQRLASRPILHHLVICTALFGTFPFLAYVMLYALTQRQPNIIDPHASAK